MELWIARDKDKSLNLYFSKPKKLEERGFFCSLWRDNNFITHISMNKRDFPDVTWENSPKKVRIELVEDVAKSDTKGKFKTE